MENVELNVENDVDRVLETQDDPQTAFCFDSFLGARLLADGRRLLRFLDLCHESPGPDPAGAGHCRHAIHQRRSTRVIVWNDVFSDGGGLRRARSPLAIEMA